MISATVDFTGVCDATSDRLLADPVGEIPGFDDASGGVFLG
jgi:hypothetical protein